MGLGFQRAAVKSATDNIIVSPPLLRHLRSYDLCLLNWTSRTGNVLRSLQPLCELEIKGDNVSHSMQTIYSKNAVGLNSRRRPKCCFVLFE